MKKHDIKDLIGVQTDAELLIEYLQSDIDDLTNPKRLTPRLQEKLDRIATCRSLIMQHKFSHKVLKMMKNHFGYGDISAYKDLTLTNQVFGPLLKVTKEMRRAIAEEMIRQDRDLAIEAKDTRALNMATANYIKLFNLDKEDAELPDLSKFEQHTIIIGVMPELVGANPPSEEDILKRYADWIDKNTIEIEADEQH